MVGNLNKSVVVCCLAPVNAPSVASVVTLIDKAIWNDASELLASIVVVLRSSYCRRLLVRRVKIPF